MSIPSVPNNFYANVPSILEDKYHLDECPLTMDQLEVVALRGELVRQKCGHMCDRTARIKWIKRNQIDKTAAKCPVQGCKSILSESDPLIPIITIEQIAEYALKNSSSSSETPPQSLTPKDIPASTIDELNTDDDLEKAIQESLKEFKNELQKEKKEPAEIDEDLKNTSSLHKLPTFSEVNDDFEKAIQESLNELQKEKKKSEEVDKELKNALEESLKDQKKSTLTDHEYLKDLFAEKPLQTIKLPKLNYEDIIKKAFGDPSDAIFAEKTLSTIEIPKLNIEDIIVLKKSLDPVKRLKEKINEILGKDVKTHLRSKNDHHTKKDIIAASFSEKSTAETILLNIDPKGSIKKENNGKWRIKLGEKRMKQLFGEEGLDLLNKILKKI